MAMPPRVRFSQTFSEEYMSLAMPERSSSAAMNMNKGIDMST